MLRNPTDKICKAKSGTGFIRCRLFHTNDVAHIAKFIEKRATAGHDAHFLIRELHGDDTVIAQEVRVTKAVLNRMKTQGKFAVDEIGVARSSKYTTTDISLCFTRGTSFPISGFPRELHAGKSIISARKSIGMFWE